MSNTKVVSVQNRRNNGNRTVKTVTVQQVPQSGKRRRRRRQRRRRRAGVLPGNVVPVQRGVAGGNIAAEDAVANSYRRRSRTRIRTVRGLARGTFDVSQDILWDFVEKHLDPCGEFEVLTENARIPDGANPNSLALELREADNIRAPNLPVMEVPLDGSMWSLTIIHTNAFRTPVIFIAAMNNVAPDVSIMGQFTDVWNVKSQDDGRYPNWIPFASNYYYSWYGWSALDGIDPPTVDGVATAISRYRICADGMTIGFNTPTLVDQGWGVSAQVAPDFNNETVVESPDADGEFGQFVQLVTFSRALNVLSFTTPWGNVITNVVPTTTDQFVASVAISYNATITVGGTTFAVTAGSFLRAGVRINITGGLMFTIQTSPDDVAWTTAVEVPDVTTGNVVINATIFAVLDAPPAVKINRVKMIDVVSTGALYQMTPQAFMCTMKETYGLYVVKRIWNPVFNMTNASTYAPFRFVNSKTSPNSLFAVVGGRFDTFDQNYGMSYTQINGISTSAQPIMKLRRVIEIIADAGSPYTPMMVKGSDRIEEALVIVKEFADRHPHAYPAGYNGFGTLFNIISGVLDKIPVIGNFVKPLTGVLHQLLAGGNKETSPGNQNHKEDLPGNVQELLSALLAQLGLGSC